MREIGTEQPQKEEGRAMQQPLYRAEGLSEDDFRHPYGVSAEARTARRARKKLRRENPDVSDITVYRVLGEEPNRPIVATVADNLPRTPQGFGILVFHGYCHSGGSLKDSDTRILAIPFGTHRTGYQSTWRGQLQGELDIEFVASTTPWCIHFMDCNSEYSYPLPAGSKRWVDGTWVPVEKVEYTY